MARYEVSEFELDGFHGFRLTDAGRKSEAHVFPQLGDNAALFRTTPEGVPDGLPIDVIVPPERLAELARIPFSSGIPILFAFPNRVRDGIYTFEGQTYEMRDLLSKGWDRGAGQAMHGLVDDKPWSVEQAAANDAGAFVTCSFRAESFSLVSAQFPFPCRLVVTHRLRDGLLHLEAAVHNTGETDLPLGFGLHPWFPAAILPGAVLPDAIPGIPRERRARSRVRIPADARWELEHLMPTGRVLPAGDDPGKFDLREPRALGDRDYDDVFTRVLRDARGWSEAALGDPESEIELFVSAGPGFREWVLYAPPDRAVVAIEPYSCTTDAANLAARGIDSGLVALPPGATWRGEVEFGLRAAL
ncbi:MAG TPA: aldose 1-epimerase [Thermoanaerobaculia bacterium]|nr:aldose 1-epimerase [Thermoanaerobaculia bacterium]